jgi:hypothetical protein
MDWAPTNEVIETAEQILVDSIWITAFEYFSNWDTQKVDIYNFDIKEFKDSVVLKLYDEKIGESWKMPLTDLLSILVLVHVGEGCMVVWIWI